MIGTQQKADLARICAHNVSLSYPRDGASFPVVDAISLNINVGEFAALVGPSGCGKSSLLRMMAGLQKPTSGRIEQDGEQVRRPSAKRAVVFQSYANLPWLRARDNVAFGLTLRRVTQTKRYEIAMRLLEAVGLADHANAYPHQLSGGMQQRLAIARALAVEPPVLLMDEPFGALDPLTRRSMQRLIRQLVSDRSTTIAFVTHDTEEAVFLADRIFVFSPRPACIVREIPVRLASRSLDVMETEDFRKIEQDVRSALRMGILSTMRAESGSFLDMQV